MSVLALVDCNNFYASCEKLFDTFTKTLDNTIQQHLLNAPLLRLIHSSAFFAHIDSHKQV